MLHSSLTAEFVSKLPIVLKSSFVGFPDPHIDSVNKKKLLQKENNVIKNCLHLRYF
jgi:hypothetical protein